MVIERRRSELVALVVVLFAAASCGSSGGTAKDGGAGSTGAGGGPGTGGGAPDAGAQGGSSGKGGAGGQGGSSGKGGAGGGAAGAGGGVCAHEIDNPACWSERDLTGFTELQQGFFGAIFDGRYVIYVNSTTGTPDDQIRYDTQGSFTGAGWSAFDTESVVGIGYVGGAFDGRYAYLTPTMPENNGAAGQNYDAIVARYDTQAAFNTTASWSTFNLTRASGTPDLTVPGFEGAAFDGRYVYFAPSAAGTTVSGHVARYDTQAGFTTAASWSSFDLTTVDAAAGGFAGVVLGGRYLYFVPHATSNARAARYDTQASFTAAASWSTFEVTTLNPAANGFTGGVFDGRYVYFAPASAIFDSPTIIVRHDTQGTFTDAASWGTFDTTAIQSSATWDYEGAAFDGRYVYFIPSHGDPLLRFDAQGSFTDAASWKAQRLFDVAPNSGGYSGAAFDGRYLYLVPNDLEDALRFDARDAGPLPATYNGSFY
jgi:hypothetical protein